MRYNWQLADWPAFQFDAHGFDEQGFVFAQQVGASQGQFDLLGYNLQQELLLDMLVSEAIRTSAIEGEFISRQDVVSSLKRHMGFVGNWPHIRDKRSEGLAELLVLSRSTYRQPLSEDALFGWHKLLMKGSYGVTVGQWRSGSEPMQVVSGRIGQENVHFEAPPSVSVPAEMERFFSWFNSTAPGQPAAIVNPLLRAGIAHLYFETIHPFEDGNGRIGRVIAEKALSQTIGRPVLLSLSKTIEAHKAAYYAALQEAQRSNEISAWLAYFTEVIQMAQTDFLATLRFVIQKTRFLDNHKNGLNERQQKVIVRMLEAGPDGFAGGMNARKYISIAKTSKATATRDLQDLSDKQILKPAGGGRNTHYTLILPE